MTNKKRPFEMVPIAACIMSALVAGGAVYLTVPWWLDRPAAEADGSHDNHGDEHGGGGAHDEEENSVVRLPKEMWEASRLKVAPAKRQSMTISTWATGKVMLNADRAANIFSITEGRAHEVPVGLGQRVEQGQVLAIIDSREVGSAKLALYQARLQEEFARQENDFAQRVKKNASDLIEALSAGKSVEEINSQLGQKPIGKYRNQLLGAHAELIRARADYDRIKPIAETGAVPGSQLIQVEASFRSAEASYNAVIEQLRFSIPQDALRAEQAHRQAQQAVDVAKAQLNILGYSEDQLRTLKPGNVGEDLSHYEVKSPFAGTVISKSVVLAERVGTDTEMFRIADLSTVWVQADIYQKDLPAIAQLGKTLRFRAPSTDNGTMHTHQGKIFYHGDVIDAKTRTLLLRALADNEDGHLKPGMFVEIEIPGEKSTIALAIPESAVLEIDNQTVVFVQESETNFRKVPVIVGPANNGMVPVQEGLKEGDVVVTSGAFSLKSELLKGEISHGH